MQTRGPQRETLNLVPLQLQMDIGGPWAAHSGMACFVDIGYCYLLYRTFAGYFPLSMLRKPRKGWNWRRGVLPPGMCCVFGESGDLVKPASGGKFSMTGEKAVGNL